MKKDATEEHFIEAIRELEEGRLSEEEIEKTGREVYQNYLSAPSIEEVRERLGKKS